MAKSTPKPTVKPKVAVTKKVTPMKKETRIFVGKGKNKAGTVATPGWQKGRGTI